MKILILGGYGTFGGRLAILLRDEPGLTLLIAGRSPAAARAFCERLGGRVRAEPLPFDRDGDVEAQLAAAAPDILVDASGPFQAYGNDPYRVVEACIRRRVTYLDLADGSDFVEGIRRFDAAAKAAGVAALSGLSSFPVLTAAVLRRLAEGLDSVERVEAGVAPSPHAGVGLNVIRAVAGYAGQPVRLRRGGRDAFGHGLTEARRFTVAPPGAIPLEPRRFALVDVPDLRALPALRPELREVWAGAAPVPAILHRGLTGLAWLVRLGVLGTLSPFASLFHGAVNRLRWGEHRGGMIVRVSGTVQGEPVLRSWHLLAEGDDGPLIPSMAAEALIRKTLAGHRLEPGARSAVDEVRLADYERSFAGRSIVTGEREEMPASAADPLYARVLGSAFGGLPETIRAMHDIGSVRRAEGVADVDGAEGTLARCLAWAFRLPRSGRDLPLQVSLERQGARELWRRRYPSGAMTSTQEQGRGRFEGLLVERFGPFAFGLALVAGEGKLRLVLRRWTAFGLPLPRAVGPRIEAFESVQDGRFRFHVEIGLPGIGRLVRYRGWLVPSSPGTL